MAQLKDTDLYGTLTVNGEIYFKTNDIDNEEISLLDLYYPIGTVYTSVVYNNGVCMLEEVFGGTWELLKNVFLMASNCTGTKGESKILQFDGDPYGVNPNSLEKDGGRKEAYIFNHTHDYDDCLHNENTQPSKWGALFGSVAGGGTFAGIKTDTGYFGCGIQNKDDEDFPIDDDTWTGHNLNIKYRHESTYQFGNYKTEDPKYVINGGEYQDDNLFLHAEFGSTAAEEGNLPPYYTAYGWVRTA